MINAKSCSESYQNGERQRKDTPMDAGAIYKIREVRSDSSSYFKDIEIIGACVTGDSKARYRLRHCTTEDKAYWTRKLPAGICFALGRDVAATFYALNYDGVPPDKIKYLQDYAVQKIPVLCELGDQAYHDVKNNWKQASKLFALQKGPMFDFINEVDNFLSYVLNEINLWTR